MIVNKIQICDGCGNPKSKIHIWEDEYGNIWEFCVQCIRDFDLEIGKKELVGANLTGVKN